MGISDIMKKIKGGEAKAKQVKAYKPPIQDAVKILAGVVALTPIGKGLLIATTKLSDAITHNNAADQYLGLDKDNSTLSMLPGGLLAQQVLQVADPSLANKINSTIPDPKKMAINDAKTLAMTAATNPSQLKTVAKQVAYDNGNKLNGNLNSAEGKPSVAPPTTTLNNPNQKPIMMRPSLLHFKLPERNVEQQHTIINNTPTLTTNTNKPSLLDAPTANSTLNNSKDNNALPSTAVSSSTTLGGQTASNTAIINSNQKDNIFEAFVKYLLNLFHLE
jgi:hypothetical protein